MENIIVNWNSYVNIQPTKQNKFTQRSLSCSVIFLEFLISKFSFVPEILGKDDVLKANFDQQS